MLFYLDIAIGLVFVYFFLSLLCSVMIEGVAAWSKKRPRMLFDAIFQLLADEEAVNNIYKHPLFLGVSPKEAKEERKKPPSYISSRSFILALLDSLKKHSKVIKKMEEEKKKISELNIRDNARELLEALGEDNQIRQALIPLLELAKNDFDKALDSMEKWYDEAMDRVTGWYKRWSQCILLILAFFVALVLNADTFYIGKEIYRDQTLREGLVAAAGEVVKSRSSTPQKPAQTTPSSPQKPPSSSTSDNQKPAASATANIQQPSLTSPSTPQKPTSGKPPISQGEADDIEVIKKYAPKLPLGWPEPEMTNMLAGVRDPSKFLGILFTAVLVSLGSTFWFELLNKLINLRNAGKKPPTKEELEAQKSQTKT